MPDIQLIPGKVAGSKEEARVAIALKKQHIPFVYHYSIRGGGAVRGGYIIDFVIKNPFEIPLEVFGEYWHRGEIRDRDRLKIAILFSIFRREPIILWGSELHDQNAADTAVRRKVV